MSGVAGTRPWPLEDLRGCRGVFTMDYDGLPLQIVRSGPGGADPHAIGAAMAVVLQEARQAGLDLALGPLRGVSVRSAGPTLIFQACGQDHLLVAVIDRAASAVVARRALAEAALAGATSP